MAPAWLEGIVKFWADLDFREDVGHIRDQKKRERQIVRLLDNVGFSWRIYFVAASGFLASSWSLIATNIVTPGLYYIYPPEDRLSIDAGLAMDEVTLTSTIIGMIIFGHFADRLGRKWLYGYELLIILSALIGLAFASEGFVYTAPNGSISSSMNIYASLFWWRFFLGLGIGAEYPMSAIIATEFAATQSRGRLVAAVFFAQSVGRLTAYLIGYGALHGISREYGFAFSDPSEKAKIIVDVVWRLVVGLAGVPALLAIGLRMTIPETPRFYSAIRQDWKKAHESALLIGGPLSRSQSSDNSTLSSGVDPNESEISWWRRAKGYFFGKPKGIKPLAMMCLLWFMLDFAFYGTGLDSPATVNTLWTYADPPAADAVIIPPGYGSWKSDPANVNATIAETLNTNMERIMKVTSLPSIAGSFAVIPIIDYFERQSMLAWLSLFVSGTFLVVGATVRYLVSGTSRYVSIVFYALSQFLINMGPNTLIFVLAAEIFPTEYRGTCYGLAAAAGKLGAVVIRPVTNKFGKGHDGVSTLFFVYAVVMFSISVMCWVQPLNHWIPRVQAPREKPHSKRNHDDNESQDDQEDGVTGWRRFLPTRLKNLPLEEISPWPPQGETAGRPTQAVVGLAQELEEEELSAPGSCNSADDLGWLEMQTVEVTTPGTEMNQGLIGFGFGSGIGQEPHRS